MFYKPTDLAWAAGIIDGEGCIRINRRNMKRRVTPNYSLHLKVKMVHKPTIQRLRDLFDVGSVSRESPGKNNKRVAWRWNVYGADVFFVLAPTLMWLFTKNREARIAMRFEHLMRPRIGNGIAPAYLCKAREKFYRKLRDEKKYEWPEVVKGGGSHGE